MDMRLLSRRRRLVLLSALERLHSVLLDERDQALQATVALVVDPSATTGGLELERREAGYAEWYAGREVVLGRVHLTTIERTQRE